MFHAGPEKGAFCGRDGRFGPIIEHFEGSEARASAEAPLGGRQDLHHRRSSGARAGAEVPPEWNGGRIRPK